MTEATTHSDKNGQYWDSKATSYDTNHWAQGVLALLADSVKSNLDWIGVDWVKKDDSEQDEKEIRMLDYACGPGTVARVLYPKHVSQVRGIDVSAGMVAEFNKRTEAQGFSPEQMFATQGDLLAKPNPESTIAGSEYFNFDLVTCSMAFHHFDDPELAAKRMVERLKPGTGTVLIIDWTPDEDVRAGQKHGEHHGHGASHSHGTIHQHGPDQKHMSPHGQYPAHESDPTIAHGGFSKERMASLLRAAGCVDIDYIVMEKPFKFGEDFNSMEKTGFLARGRKAS